MCVCMSGWALRGARVCHDFSVGIIQDSEEALYHHLVRISRELYIDDVALRPSQR